MGKMNRQRALLDYLRKVNQLEKTIYVNKQIGHGLLNQINSLGHPQSYQAPQKAYVTKGRERGEDIGFWIGFSVVMVIVVFGLVVVPAMAGHPTGVGMIVLGLIGGIFIGLMVGAITGFIAKQFGKIPDKLAENQIDRNRAAEAMEVVAQDNDRINWELSQVKPRLQKQLEQLRNELRSTENVLNKYYSMGILHPKYQNLIAVSSFCEYFETGRCSQLEGHEGAYNIFEQEIRMDRIITKMDIALAKLDEIKDNQYYLYQAVQESNDNLLRIERQNQQMLDSLQIIEENSALTEYNSRCAANRAAAISDMLVIRQALGR